jgi:hypothetical protein
VSAGPVRQPTHDEGADLQTRSGSELAAAASAAVEAAAASAVTAAAAASAAVEAAAAASAVTAAAAASADNGRRSTDLSHAIDNIAEIALAAMRFVVNN